MVWEGVVAAQEEMIPAERRQWRRKESRTTGEVEEMRCGEQPHVVEVRRTAPGLSDQRQAGVIRCRMQC